MKNVVKNKNCLKLNDKLSDSPIILIRHIRSLFNQMHDIAKEKDDVEFDNSVRFNTSLFDTDIIFKGEDQMERAKNLLNFNIKYIVVSPMYRALKTAFESIKIIEKSETSNPPIVEINPYLFEKLEDSCDLLPDLKKTMLLYDKFSFKNKTYNIDWSIFNNDKIEEHYQLNYMKLLKMNGKLLRSENYYMNNYENLKNSNQNLDYYDFLKDFVLSNMKKLGDVKIEDGRSVQERLSLVTKRIKELLNTLDSSKNEKILIVGHSVIFASWYAENLHEETLDFCQETTMRCLYNCEIIGADFS